MGSRAQENRHRSSRVCSQKEVSVSVGIRKNESETQTDDRLQSQSESRTVSVTEKIQEEIRTDDDSPNIVIEKDSKTSC